jgi:hypothetical protein
VPRRSHLDTSGLRKGAPEHGTPTISSIGFFHTFPYHRVWAAQVVRGMKTARRLIGHKTDARPVPRLLIRSFEREMNTVFLH